MALTRYKKVGIAAAALSLLLVGCSGGDQEDPELTALTVGLTYIPNVQFAPFYLAESAGYFEAHGLDVTLRHHGENEDVFGAVLDGTEDVVVSGGTEVLQARAGGSDLTSIATLYQTYPVSLLVLADSPIQTPADLVGHSVGIPGPFGDSYLGMLAMFDAFNLDSQQVDVQSIGFTGQHALAQGHVDAIMAFSNNEPVLLEQAGQAVRNITLDSVPLVGSGVATRSELLSADAGPVTAQHLQAFTLAVGQAIDDLHTDPQSGLAAALEFIPGTADEDSRQVMTAVLEATIALYGSDGETWGASDASLWDAMAQFLADAGIVDRVVSSDEVMTNELFREQ